MSGSGRVLASGDRLAQALELGLAVLDRPQPPVPVVQALEGTLEGPSRRDHGGFARTIEHEHDDRGRCGGQMGRNTPETGVSTCEARMAREAAGKPDFA